MEKSIFYDTAIDLVLLEDAVDNDAYESAVVDMQGYDGVCFVAAVGLGAVTTSVLTVEQDDSAAMTSAATLAGAEANVVTAVAADGLALVEVVKPTARYVRAVLTVPDITAVPAAIIAIRFRARSVPRANEGVSVVSPGPAA